MMPCLTDTMFVHPVTTRVGNLEIVTCDMAKGGVVFVRRLQSGEMIFLSYRRLKKIIEGVWKYPAHAVTTKNPTIHKRFHVGGQMFLSVKDPALGIRLGDYTLIRGVMVATPPELRISLDEWKGFETLLDDHVDIGVALESVPPCVESMEHFEAICGPDHHCAECDPWRGLDPAVKDTE